MCVCVCQCVRVRVRVRVCACVCVCGQSVARILIAEEEVTTDENYHYVLPSIKQRELIN